MQTITVLGGGVAGLSVAFQLGLLGIPTKLVAERRSDRDRSRSGLGGERFASAHGVASILTHSVQSDHTLRWLETSVDFFQRLNDFSLYGVGKHRHFEVFEEFVPEIPRYLEYLHNHDVFVRRPPPGCPLRNGIADVWGWSFDCLFVNPESYFPLMFKLLTKELGVRVSKRKVTRTNWSSLAEGDVVVNCLGAGSLDVFDDPSPPRFIRGGLVYIDAPIPYSTATGGQVSYNYHPGPGVYKTAGQIGRGGDLYFYPRTDRLVLGGTREEGIDLDGEWHGEVMDCEYILVGDHRMPAPMLNLNAEIVQNLTGLDIRNLPMTSNYGMRFTRRDGVRREAEELEDRLVVHYYGGGGAGITLSWGGSVEVVGDILKRKNLGAVPQFENRLLQTLQRLLQQKLEALPG